MVRAFLESDIPLYKLRQPSLQNLFSKFELPFISHSSAHNMVSSISKEKTDQIEKLLKDKQIFVIIDETQINSCRYINVLFGNLLTPNKSYLVKTFHTENSVNAEVIVRFLDDALKSYNIQRENFLLLITDAARYMVAGGKTLSILYPSMTHITCLLHLLHNVCLKIRAHYPNIDDLIATTKASIVKNKTRSNMFNEIGQPPDVILTRWGTWLKGVLYYHHNFNQVKRIINGYSDGGLLVSRNKEAVNNPLMEGNLSECVKNYMGLVSLIERFEEKEFTIGKGVEVLQELDLGNDPVGLKDYITKRLKGNQILTIVNSSTDVPKFTMKTRILLLECQCTSIDVERSFSMLRRMLRSERNFDKKNVNNYMICYFNKEI